MDYLSYEADDFAADESFQNWVYRSHPEPIQFWEEWLQLHPQKQDAVAQAVQMLHQLKFTEGQVPVTQIHASWQKLDALLDQPSDTPAAHPTRSRSLAGNSWYKLAAAVTGILLAATISWFMLRQKQVAYTTAYGKMSQITLPDGSTVTLNGNSALRYPTDWETADNREVWLEGEAFFRVVKQTRPRGEHTSGRKFIVHTSGLDVEVLGTTFTVLRRKTKTRVVLNSGQVKIESPLLAAKGLIMRPGELIEVSHQNNTLTRKTVNPQNFSAWTNKKLIFDNTTVGEIAWLLEETYGLKVTTADPLLLEQKVSGSIPNENIEVLLTALSRSFDLHIVRTADSVQFRNP